MSKHLLDVYQIPLGSSFEPQQAALWQWSEATQQRWIELIVETLSKQRELLESLCRASVRAAEQLLLVSDAPSPDEYRHVLEERVREFQQLATRWSAAAMGVRL